jgi:hypothetical protein
LATVKNKLKKGKTNTNMNWTAIVVFSVTNLTNTTSSYTSSSVIAVAWTNNNIIVGHFNGAQ